MSGSSREDVSTTTGIALVRALLLSCCRTSSPSTLGSLRSKRTTFGVAPSDASAKKSIASAPSRQTCTRFSRLRCFRARSVNSASCALSSTRSISTPLCISTPPRQREVKRGALIELPFSPDPPAVPRDDPLDDRQADAGAFKVLRAVQALEYAEQLVRITRVEPGAVVADVVNGLVVFWR